MKKRILSVIISLALCLSLLPVPVYAEGAEGDATETYTAAGVIAPDHEDGGIFGTAWDYTNTDNDLTWNEEKDRWEITYTDVSATGAADDDIHYEYKVYVNHSAKGSYNDTGLDEKGGNYAKFDVEKDGSTVVICFDGSKTWAEVTPPADTTPAKITGVTVTVDGVPYTEGEVTITADTESIVYTVTGTNFANLSGDQIIAFISGAYKAIREFTVDTAANTATWEMTAEWMEVFKEIDYGFEVVYSNDRMATWNETGIFLTYDDGIPDPVVGCFDQSGMLLAPGDYVYTGDTITVQVENAGSELVYGWFWLEEGETVSLGEGASYTVKAGDLPAGATLCVHVTDRESWMDGAYFVYYGDKPVRYVNQKGEEVVAGSKVYIGDTITAQYTEEADRVFYQWLTGEGVDKKSLSTEAGYTVKAEDVSDGDTLYAHIANGDGWMEVDQFTVEGHGDYTYTAKDGTITYGCGYGCGHTVGTATLKAADKFFDGKPVQATVETTGILAEEDVTVIYCCQNGCVRAGEHTASITIGGKTVTVSFTIKSRPYLISWEDTVQVTSADTGDESGILYWGGAMLASLAALTAALTVFRKRKNAK